MGRIILRLCDQVINELLALLDYFPFFGHDQNIDRSNQVHDPEEKEQQVSRNQQRIIIHILRYEVIYQLLAFFSFIHFDLLNDMHQQDQHI
jgi:hypothetical protein